MHFSYISPPRRLNAPAHSLHYYLVKLHVKLQPTSFFYALRHCHLTTYVKPRQPALGWGGDLCLPQKWIKKWDSQQEMQRESKIPGAIWTPPGCAPWPVSYLVDPSWTVNPTRMLLPPWGVCLAPSMPFRQLNQAGGVWATSVWRNILEWCIQGR